MGQIADTLQARGDLDEALRIRREEVLPVYERLGDLHRKSAALWQVAQVLLADENFEEALPLVGEDYAIVSKLDQLDGICVIGVVWGQFMVAGGKIEEGLGVLQRSLVGFNKLDQAEAAERVAGIIRQAEENSDRDER